MGYDLQVERHLPDGLTYDSQVPIAHGEFLTAIEQISVLRVTEKDPYVFANPETGHTISVHRDPDRGTEGARIELFFPEKNEWHWVFTYGDGVISFRAPDQLPDGPVWQAATEVARRLAAQIVGQDGEVYSLQTGDVIGELV